MAGSNKPLPPKYKTKDIFTPIGLIYNVLQGKKEKLRCSYCHARHPFIECPFPFCVDPTFVANLRNAMVLDEDDDSYSENDELDVRNEFCSLVDCDQEKLLEEWTTLPED